MSERKKELIEKHKNGQLEPIGTIGITNTISVAVCHIDHGIEDMVFGYKHESENHHTRYFYVKIRYEGSKARFRLGNTIIDLGEIVDLGRV